MKNVFVALFLCVLFAPIRGFGQDSSDPVLSFEVNRVYPPISITRRQLEGARTLFDLHKRYPSSWVKEYLSVVISTNQGGETRNVEGRNEILNPGQKELMEAADAGADISVTVRYIPKNSLPSNDPKEIRFKIVVDPENEASFSGGAKGLDLFLRKNVIESIPDSIFTGYRLAAVKFTVDEEGMIADPHLFWTSENEKVDSLLLETVCNMPAWRPAVHADGTPVKQEFAFMVGNMQSCVVNLLNIRRN